MMKQGMNPSRVRSIAFFMVIMLQFMNCLSVIFEVPEQIQVQQMRCPMVVEFYRPSCPHCRNMAPIYDAVAQKCTNGTSFYKVKCDNIEYAQGIAKKITRNSALQINGVPTFVFIDAKGNTKEIKQGGMSKQELESKVSQLP